MQIKCIHCSYISKSLIVDQDKALGDVLLDFSKHITNLHTGDKNTPYWKMMNDLRIVTSIAATVILLAKHSNLLDPNTPMDMDDYVQTKFTYLVEQLQDCLGIEVFDNKPMEKEIIVKLDEVIDKTKALLVNPVSGTLPNS